MTLSIYRRLKRRFNPTSSEQRRCFLKSIATLGAASLISNQIDRVRASDSSRRVVVVGAGLAGLACAYELKMAGFSVIVMEARHRIAGRVLSLEQLIPNQIVEGGGEFIGENHPTWWAYKEKFRLAFSEIPIDEELDMPIYLDGRRLGFQAGDKLYRQMEQALSSMNDLAISIDADSPWLSPKAIELDHTSVAHWLSRLSISEPARKLTGIQLSSDNAVPNELASLLGMLTAVKGGGLQKFWESSETHRCTLGNQQLAIQLAQEIGSDQIYLNRPVASIDYGGRMIQVVDANGQIRECDDVVLAIPPSTWSKIQFTPPLPIKLNPQMGTALKYLAVVNRRFWLDDKMSADSLTDGPISQTWDATSGQPKRSARASLIAFSGGAQADACSRFSKEQRDLKYREEFAKLYPNYAEHFVASRMMDWPKDPWALAGYSFPAPGQVTTQGPILHAGLGRMHFCGEHTCYKFIGYMEGALNSGASLAKRLATRDA